MITQAELNRLEEKKEKVRKAMRGLERIQAQIRDVEVDIFTRLQNKEKVEKGRWFAFIKRTAGRASVKWKDEFIKVAGHAKAQKLIDNARQDVDSIQSLVIEDSTKVAAG